MKRRLVFISFLLSALCLVLVPDALASATLYVNGLSGSDSHNCLSPSTACKTIGHAISLASSGDTILVAAATYTENLAISKSLTIVGFGASTTIIDGGGVRSVVTISSATAHVSLFDFTIRHGSAQDGGGVSNQGILIINKSTISGNAAGGCKACGGFGGGIDNLGNLTLNNSTVTGNTASGPFGAGAGAGISNSGTVTVNNSTLSGNVASARGGGIENGTPLRGGKLSINSSTISGNSAQRSGGGIDNLPGSAVALQNSIVANSPSGGSCSGTITSKGYNLSSDNTCNFNGPGDMNNTNPMLGPLQNNGGPTQTQALLPGSPAIDAGNPSGCTDGLGHLLKTDQRGKPRPDTEDTGGCDMGAYERQSATATSNILSVLLTGGGSGTVTSNPAGINCGTSCTASFSTGMAVNLTAAPASKSQFFGWSGACTGTNACNVMMTSDEFVTATFNTGPPEDFSLSPASTKLTLQPGAQGTDVVTIAGLNGPFGSAIQLTCAITGPAPMPTCALSATSVAPGANSATSTLTITAPAAVAMQLPSSRRSLSKFLYALWLPLMFGITVVGTSKKLRRQFWVVGGLLLLVLLAACGGSNSGSGGGTPTNYTVTVTGTSGPIQHTAQVTVTVR